MFAVIAYADLDRLLSRLDETRQLGLAHRVAIWRDTLGIVRDFPFSGAGAGNFSNAMRLYQTTDRTYFWNEAHNQYLQLAAEGGLLFVIPMAVALAALMPRRVAGLLRRPAIPCGGCASAPPRAWWRSRSSRSGRPALTLPANGMLAAVAAAILVHRPAARTRHAPAGD